MTFGPKSPALDNLLSVSKLEVTGNRTLSGHSPDGRFPESTSIRKPFRKSKSDCREEHSVILSCTMVLLRHPCAGKSGEEPQSFTGYGTGAL
jgi:hypothetical protein